MKLVAKIHNVLKVQGTKEVIYVINQIINVNKNANLTKNVINNVHKNFPIVIKFHIIVIQRIAVKKNVNIVIHYAITVSFKCMKNIFVKNKVVVKKCVCCVIINAHLHTMIMIKQLTLLNFGSKTKKQNREKKYQENFTTAIVNMIVEKIVAKKEHVHINIKIVKKNGIKKEFNELIFILSKLLQKKYVKRKYRKEN